MSWLAAVIVVLGFICLVLLFLIALLRLACSYDMTQEVKARREFLAEIEHLPSAHEWRRHGQVGRAHFNARRESF